eukprot:CAMPEP_0171703646 /NCGR_PEP_ID=MMETSP0991-20121206/12240_1 /TAXON_ID=483369 /ORGANISM="non described non described, Strain CCMP2098" /LENGTH=407 /DNA_ID=CAMNT_0012293069 /DNA_START=423 /DNA_END=1646 /DNA_ORIENTATION=+
MSHRHDPRLAINEEKSSDSSSNLAAVQAVASFSRGTHLVGKKTFSDEQRLVFFAGIEGTGHHFWSAVFDDQAVGALATADPHEFGPAGELWQLAKQGPELCNKACDDPSSTSSALLPNRSHSPKALKEAIANLVGKLAADHSRDTSSSSSLTTAVVPMNAWKSRGTLHGDGNNHGKSPSSSAAASSKKPTKGKASLVPPESRYGMLSFPNWWEPEKSLKHPNLRLLASAAEAGGADLRVVVLLRNSRDVLKSTAVKRVESGGFSLPMGREAAILADNTAVLMAQLSLLDPSFFVCVEMDALDETSFGAVGEFIGIKPRGSSSSHAWSLEALVGRGLVLPTRREPLRSSLRADAAHLTSKALGLDSPSSSTDSAEEEGFEPFTETQATTLLADLITMELLFRETVCGL